MKPSYWDSPALTERRSEVRLEGKRLEGVECAVLSPHAQEGWDQPTRIPAKLSNLSAGGLEVEAEGSFPFAVDAAVTLELRFGGAAGNSDWLSMPAIVRHVHFVERGCLVGMQFLWKDVKDSETEYRLCDHLLRLERRQA